jgi:hypothetical protein
MKLALRRHATGETRVVSILVHPVDYERTPLTTVAVLPTNNLPISSWPDREAAWLDVVRALRRIIHPGLPATEVPAAAPVRYVVVLTGTLAEGCCRRGARSHVSGRLR